MKKTLRQPRRVLALHINGSSLSFLHIQQPVPTVPTGSPARRGELKSGEVAMVFAYYRPKDYAAQSNFRITTVDVYFFLGWGVGFWFATSGNFLLEPDFSKILRREKHLESRLTDLFSRGQNPPVLSRSVIRSKAASITYLRHKKCLPEVDLQVSRLIQPLVGAVVVLGSLN